MTDLCMYELDNIAWDDFYQCGDHIVPHPSYEQPNQKSVQCNSRKRPRHEASCVESDAGDSSSSKQISQEKAEQRNLTLHHRRSKMLEKEWSNKSDRIFPSCDSESINETSILVSDGTKTSNRCYMNSLQSGGSELCANDSILSDKSAAVSNSFDYQLDRLSERDNDLSFFNDHNDGKDSNDLLYYSWADMGNFEDVDRMLRSCDSTFGLSTSEDDDLGWFSSSDAIGGSEDVLKSNFKFSCPDSSCLSISENNDTSRLNSMACSINKSDMQNSSALFKGSCWPSVKGESGQVGLLSFSNESGCSDVEDNKDKSILKDQGFESSNGVKHKMSDTNNVNDVVIDEQNKQLKHQNQPEMGRSDQLLENRSLFYVENIPQSGQQQTEAVDTGTFGYLHGDASYICSDFSCPSDQKLLHPPPSVIKSENSNLTSLSPKNSDEANQVQSLEVSQKPSLPVISFAGEKRELIDQKQGFPASSCGNIKAVDLAFQASMSGTTTMEEPIHYSGKNHPDGVVNMGMSEDFGSFPEQESSMSSGLRDISVEATSFCQLQLVMERLDLRTKLCIRDSLYRLAQSAEQRHHFVELNGGSADNRDSMLAGERNKFTGFMDMETDTNPIDRSIAHLLFHRPTDASAMADNNSLSFDSAATPIHGSINSSPVMAEDLVRSEENPSETDRNVAGK